MGVSCVPVEPTLSTDPTGSWSFHPLPIDVGEVSKLSEIEQTRVFGHFEAVRETRRKATGGRASANPDVITGTALRVTLSPGVVSELPPSLYELGLKAPLFELLRPSVVVRRRPKRMKLLGLA